MKALECYQPRGIAKLAFFVLGLGMIPFCGHLVMKDEETCGYIVYVLFFIIPILLGILAIFVYRISVIDNYIIIRKWYGRRVKVKLDDITKVVFADDSAGNPICMKTGGENQESIFFCDHELENANNGYLLMSKVADSFNEFIEKLYIIE